MITLDYADKRPLYEQTKEKLRELIITGVLKPHDKIPSVRELASKLSINPNTIQKAYHELEQEGYIYSKAAKGNYVSPIEDRQVHGSQRRSELLEILESTALELKLLGCTRQDLDGIIEKIYNKEEESDD